MRALFLFTTFWVWGLAVWGIEVEPRMGLGTSTLTLSVTDPSSGSNAFQYRPNVSSFYAVGFSTENLNLNLKLPSSRSDDTEAKKRGNTEATDFQFSFFKNQWSHDLFFQRYRGFYIDGDKDHPQPFVNEDLRLDHHGYQATFTFNPIFRMGMMINQQVLQLKSGGSWLLIGGLSHHHLRTDRSLVPSYYSLTTSPDTAKIREDETLSVKFGGGYGYNWLFKKSWFMGGAMSLLNGFHRADYKTTSESSSHTYSAMQWDVRLGVGYHGERLLYGLSSISNQTRLEVGSAQMISESQNFLLYLGAPFEI